MPSVVTYWQFPEDELEFLAYLEKTGMVMAVPSARKKNRADAMPEPIRSFIERHGPDGLDFGIGDLEQMITTHRYGDEVLFWVPLMDSDVISYSRGRLRDGKIAQSNLCVYWHYADDETKQLVSKDLDFIKWSRSILNWVRKKTPEKVECNGYPYRATKRVKDAVCQGLVQAVLY